MLICLERLTELSYFFYCSAEVKHYLDFNVVSNSACTRVLGSHLIILKDACKRPLVICLHFVVLLNEAF
jgi:hypothetical protein